MTQPRTDDAPMTDREALLHALRQRDVEVDQVLTGLSVHHLTRIPAVGPWDIRDVIAHCVAHDQFTVDELGVALDPEAPRLFDYDSLDSFNAGAVAAMRALEPRMVIAAWRTSRRAVIALVEGLPDEAFAPGSELEGRLGDPVPAAVGLHTHEHWALHVQDIRRALGAIL